MTGQSDRARRIGCAVHRLCSRGDHLQVYAISHIRDLVSSLVMASGDRGRSLVCMAMTQGDGA